MASMVDIAVIKLGKKGSLVKQGPEEHSISIEKVKSLDSTGAGDLYAAGFIYGLCREQSLETSGKIGAILGAYITEVIGAKMDDDTWHTIREKIKEICCN